jgi:hypothetical protein
MRFTVSEKQELIKMVVESDLGVNRTLREISLIKSTFYKWYKSIGVTNEQAKSLLINGLDFLFPHMFPTFKKNMLIFYYFTHPFLYCPFFFL